MKTTKTIVTENAFGYTVEYEDHRLVFGRQRGDLNDSLVVDDVLLLAFDKELCAVDFQGNIIWSVPADRSTSGKILPWIGLRKTAFDYDNSGIKKECIVYADLIEHIYILLDIHSGKSLDLGIRRWF